MRCIALAEELTREGYEALFLLDAGEVPFIEDQLSIRGFEYQVPTRDLGATLSIISNHDPVLVVVDSYVLPNFVYTTLYQRYLTLAIVDGDLRERQAHIYLDQNIGSEFDQWDFPQGCESSIRLAGLDYALIRDEILRYRPTSVGNQNPTKQPRVLMMLGGTDPTNTSPLLAKALAATAQPFSLTAIAATDRSFNEISSIECLPDQIVKPIRPTTEVAKLICESHLVISASGTSSWELLCLGAPTAFVCVAQNQVESYSRILAKRLGVGLGESNSLPTQSQRLAATLSNSLEDVALRNSLSENGWTQVDGLGRRRVFQAIEAMLK